MKIIDKQFEQEEQVVDAAKSAQAEVKEAEQAEQLEQVEKTEVEILTEKSNELADKLLRLTAEFDNFRKRTQKEKENLYKDAQAATIGAFLDVLDNLERAALAGDGDDLSKGVELVIAQFKSVLEKMGVSVIDPQGEAFNPDLHNAVSHIEDENVGENIVVNVFQKGYIMGDRVIRFAMVQVAN
ncbi:MAG: nucleotide exchange factor GrpE [Oscillospiraceae bacterium]|nr:nucleotide exchange factor GrpE [Oscillospiraceae bacterium]